MLSISNTRPNVSDVVRLIVNAVAADGSRTDVTAQCALNTSDVSIAFVDPGSNLVAQSPGVLTVSADCASAALPNPARVTVFIKGAMR